MSKPLRFILIALIGVSGLIILGASFNQPSNLGTPVKEIPFIDSSKKYTLAGEQVPIENFDVLERFERELLVNVYRHSVAIMIMKRSSRFFPVIEGILNENGIPSDFKYVVVTESEFQNVTSPSGARGFWQFLKGTAEDYGLEVSDDVDERNHLEKSTLAACKHLLSLKNRFRNWTLVAAAYNMGASALSKELEYQKAQSFYDLNLSDETNRYVFRILAFKELMENPERYGFDLPRSQYYSPLADYKIVKVDTAINSLGDFASQFGTSYRLLKVYNPWLLKRNLAKKDGKVYEIKMPN
jgi:hypothetical protein